MTTKEAKDYFNGPKGLASALNIWPTAISRWGRYPPKLRQFELEKLTKGKLKAEE
jgi:hypothetical protein|tara:strand:+ start:8842 stop:9006 length:165 start_codon:yes stop_codon:yes gene_type:complete